MALKLRASSLHIHTTYVWVVVPVERENVTLSRGEPAVFTFSETLCTNINTRPGWSDPVLPVLNQIFIYVSEAEVELRVSSFWVIVCSCGCGALCSCEGWKNTKWKICFSWGSGWWFTRDYGTVTKDVKWDSFHQVLDDKKREYVGLPTRDMINRCWY